MSSELAMAVKQICDEKGIPMDSVIETIEAALAAAFRKDFGNRLQNIKVHFNLESGGFDVYDIKTVVTDELAEEAERKKEEAAAAAEAAEAAGTPPPAPAEIPQGEDEEDDTPKYNPKTMIPLTEAKEKFPDIELEGEWKVQLEVPDRFGRMAAQTAKQVIIQKLREAERETLYQQYKDKQGIVLNAMVQRVEGRLVLIDLGNITAVLPPSEQIRSERYEVGDRAKVYLKSVEKGAKGPEITVSRTSPEIVRRLFELEVPEIAAETVEIKSVAREAGSRSKIAVVAHEENIDPIGSCVGQRGTRVQTVINELGGEKIDIIEFDENQGSFIANALAPAKVSRVEIDEEKKEATAYVAEDQLSLAIGKAGQNVRLAAQLAGLKIDIAQDGSGEVKAESDGGEEAGDEKPAEEASKEEASDETPAEGSVPETEEKEEVPEEKPEESAAEAVEEEAPAEEPKEQEKQESPEPVESEENSQEKTEQPEAPAKDSESEEVKN